MENSKVVKIDPNNPIKMEDLKVVKIDPNNPIFSNEIDKIFLQFVLKEKTRKEILEYDEELKKNYSKEELKKIFGCSRTSDKIRKFKKALNLVERQNNLIREYANGNISIEQAFFLSNLSKDRIQVLARKMRETKNKELAAHQPPKSEEIDINIQLEKGKKYSKKHLIEFMINGKITPREIIQNNNTTMKLRTVQDWLCKEKKKRSPSVNNSIKNKYESGELVIPPKNPKPSDIPIETISEICKLKAMKDCGKGGLGRKQLMEKFNILGKDTIRTITKIRHKKHYDYWFNKFSNSIQEEKNQKSIPKKNKNQEIIDSYEYQEKKIDNTNYSINVIYPGRKVKMRKRVTNDFIIIHYENKYYVVMRILSKEKFYPLVFDFEDLDLILNFEIEDFSGNWNMTNEYVTFSRKINSKSKYLHNILFDIEPNGLGEKSIDHLNRIKLDNRRCNLKLKTQSDQNRNQKTRKCQSKKINDYLLEPYKSYYLENRSKFIYWMYENTHGHRIIAGPVGNKIKQKKFSSKYVKNLAKLMTKAQNYLLDEAKKNGLELHEISSDLDPKSENLKNEYLIIISIAKKFFDIEIIINNKD